MNAQPDTGAVSPDSGDFEVREATAADEAAIRDLFRTIFKHEMTREHWHWKYARDHSRAIVVYRGSQLVAHYGGVGLDMLAEGKACKAIQITDLMVDPSFRHAVRSKSPFYQSAKMFLERFVGFGKPFLYSFGFPSDRAMLLSEKLGLHVPVGCMWELTWPLATDDYVSGYKVVRLDSQNFAGMADKINHLWEQLKTGLGKHFTLVKNADFIRWRFIEHPAKNYEVYLLLGKLLHTPKGLIVLHRDQGNCRLMDLLSGLNNLKAMIGEAKRLAAVGGGKQLMTWSTDVFVDRFECGAPGSRKLPVIIPANSCSPGPSPEQQKNKWWLLPGDTDYL